MVLKFSFNENYNQIIKIKYQPNNYTSYKQVEYHPESFKNRRFLARFLNFQSFQFFFLI